MTSSRLPRGVRQEQAVRALVRAGGLDDKSAGKGSHHKVTMLNGARVFVPAGVLKLGTLSAIIKQAGLTVDEFAGSTLGVGMNFTVQVHNAEEDGFWAEVEEIPGCITQGDSIEELETNLKEVIELSLEGLIDDYVASISSKVETEPGDTIWTMSMRLQRDKALSKS